MRSDTVFDDMFSHPMSLATVIADHTQSSMTESLETLSNNICPSQYSFRYSSNPNLQTWHNFERPCKLQIKDKPSPLLCLYMLYI